MHVHTRSIDSESRIAGFLVLVALLLHGARLVTWFNWTDGLENPPLHYRDYATHFATTWSTAHFLSEGHLWGYDPYFHAGHPSGVLFNVDNRAIEIASVAFSRLGLPLPLAFNLVVASLLILSPLALAVAVAFLGMKRIAGAAGFAVGILSWCSDPTVNWTWRGGTLAFGAASLIGVGVAAAFLRWAGLALRPDPNGRMQRIAFWVFFVVGPGLFWLHPWAFFVLLPPLALGTLLRWARWRTTQRVLLVLWVLLVLAANWPWLRLLWEWLPTKTASDQYLQGGIEQLRLEAKNPAYLLRWIVLVIAAVACRRMRRDATGSARSLGLVIGVSFLAWVGLAYGGAYVGLGDVQPHRFIIPALLLASLVSGLVLSPVSGAVVSSPSEVAPVSDLVASPVSDDVASSVSVPASTPGSGVVVSRFSHRWRLWLVALLLLASPALHFSRARGRVGADGVPRDDLSGPLPTEWEVASTLRALDLEKGRVLTNDWRLGALLPYAAGAQTIGGPFAQVWTTFGHTNASEETLLDRPVADYTPAAMLAALDTYNIHWIVVNTKMSQGAYGLPEWIENHPGFWILLSEHGVFRIYAAEVRSGWCIEGSASVTAAHNRLLVSGAAADTLVLKYHWIPSLEARPGRGRGKVPPMRLFPVPIPGDPEPFLGVATGGASDFEIVLRYGRSW